ncbi:MAG TPA: hypothetical protein VFF15_00645 [Flavobacteriaceae bacterium]|nr:hypothetical protein [Flavobacteriaceae bacterium]
MCYDNYFKFKYAIATLIALTLTSCGSYQYVGSSDDGIYDSGYENVEYVESREVETQSNDYYKNYFKEKRMEYEAIAKEDEIFTDIDSYQSETYTEQDSLTNDYRGYAGWGSASQDVVINVYSGWNNGFWWDPYWGYGWNRWNRWNTWNTWHWNMGWGYYGAFDPWYSPYFGFGWNYFGNPFWNGYYGYPYWNYGFGHHNYYRTSVAYNAGRRGSGYFNTGRTSLSRRSSVLNPSRSSYNTPRRSSTLRNYTVPRRSNSINNSSPTRIRNNRAISTPRTITPRRNNSTINSSPRIRSNSGGSISSPSRSSSSGVRSSGGGRRR